MVQHKWDKRVQTSFVHGGSAQAAATIKGRGRAASKSIGRHKLMGLATPPPQAEPLRKSGNTDHQLAPEALTDVPDV